jgi:xanthine dehydrogenase YagS FAD-binding subunit
VTPFRLLDAASAADAVALLRGHAPHARPIAAGGDLLGLLKEGVEGPTLAAPAVLVNLATARDLAQIRHDEQAWRIGAMATLARLEKDPTLPPMMAEAIGHIASPQLRARTTLGGNLLQRPRCLYFRHSDIVCLKKGGEVCAAVGGPDRAWPGALFPGICHAGHPSDLAPVLIALEAQAEIVGPDDVRMLPLVDLYQGAAHNRESEVRLRRDELLSALIVPRHTRAQAFHKVAPRLANEFSWAGAAVALSCDGDAVTAARIALSGVAPGPHVCERADECLAGQRIDSVDPGQVASQLVRVAQETPMVAARASAARLAVERALSRALQRATPGLHNPHASNGTIP